MSILNAVPFSKLATGWKHWSQRCANDLCAATVLQTGVSLRGDGVRVGENWYCGPKCFERFAEQRFTRILDSQKRAKPRHTPRMPLELVMMTRGYISEEQLRSAYVVQKSRNSGIVTILQELGYITAEQVTAATAAQWGYPVFPLKSTGPSADIRLPYHLLEKYRFLPVHLSRATEKLLLGFVAGIEHGLIHTIENITGLRVAPCFITEAEYQKFRPGVLTGHSEVVFESRLPAQEMASIAKNYATQVEANQAYFASCRDFTWIRLVHGNKHFDVMFQFA